MSKKISKKTDSVKSSQKNRKKTSKTSKSELKLLKNQENAEKSSTEESSAKKTSGEKVKAIGSGKKERVEVFAKSERSKKAIHMVMPYILALLAVFMVLCFVLIGLFPGVGKEYGVGYAGEYLRNIMCGLFGFGAFFIPLVVGMLAAMWNSAVEENKLFAKNIFALLSVVMLSIFIHIVYITVSGPMGLGTDIKAFYESGKTLPCGGVVGGLLGEAARQALGTTGALLITVVLTVVFFSMLVGVTPAYIVTLIKYRCKIRREKRVQKLAEKAEKKQAEAEEKKRNEERSKAEEYQRLETECANLKATVEELRAESEKRQAEFEELKGRYSAEKTLFDAESLKQSDAVDTNSVSADVDDAPTFSIPSESEDNTLGESVDEEAADAQDDGVLLSAEEMKNAVRSSSNEESLLNEIFDNSSVKNKPVNLPPKSLDAEESGTDVDMKLIAHMKQISDIETVPDIDDGITEVITDITETESKDAEIKDYLFPPISLLAEDKNPKDDDAKEELVENAKRLMDTLSSFNVRIKDITYSRGPTITRYELKPDVGVRVRSIANLVDDISLSLATTGVRIEAPIPNKPAVGIEVPNKNATTVYLRSLIDTEKFSGEQSKLTSCLGADVAGKPIYFNIAKMPHLLIAGATGMGKSVCINSIIVSLLYKARPDEVKLILIDPKKVEFNIYKDIPHLHTEIVSEPAKAAGALASAVAEMERRFTLIEEVGVRDIYNYNAITKDDPDREFMPQMVIIIDELADLMMTAPDAVESSICRLAQKARAAGIHIIIGTQRPSVDVITGLIKANIPSRIAFTVASQVDSRTIIDIAGAEKLIGRGDMLFSPVGASKPMRVQGAFVSEAEVEKIVEFIKEVNGPAKYDRRFSDRMEEEAASLASSGKKGVSSLGGDSDSADGLDPKFRAAVEVAMELGKISTSLLQRKLEIGYGRAAKIIDQMEEMGYVSAADGNKPRKILISKEEFMKMVLNNDID